MSGPLREPTFVMASIAETWSGWVPFRYWETGLSAPDVAGSVALLTAGAYPVSLDMFLDVFQGRGGDLASFIVLEQRLPRVTGRSSPVACSGCRERSFRASPATRWAAPTSSVSRGAR